MAYVLDISDGHNRFESSDEVGTLRFGKHAGNCDARADASHSGKRSRLVGQGQTCIQAISSCRHVYVVIVIAYYEHDRTG